MQEMIKQLFSILMKAAWILGLVLTFFAILEIAQFTMRLHDFSPMVAWSFLGGMLVIGLGLLITFWIKIRSVPKALTPPRFPPLEEANMRELRKYAEYLQQYLERLAANPNFDEPDREHAQIAVEDLVKALNNRPDAEGLHLLIDKTEKETIQPLLVALKEKAAKHVRDCVRDVMLAVTFSPYQSIDLIVILYRNLGMVVKLITVYSTRPLFREQLMIIRDVLHIVVTVNFLNAGRQLMEGLFSHMPFVGRFVDDMAQGLGAGLLTSACGYAAIERCQAFKGWDEEEATQSLSDQAKDFLADVRDIFTKDVMPNMKTRINKAAPADAGDEAGYFDKINKGVGKTMDLTGEALSTVFVKPVVATGQGVAKVATGGRHAVRGVFSYLNIFRSS